MSARRLLLAAALLGAPAAAWSQAAALRPGFSASAQKLQEMVDADLSGSAESMSAKAAAGPDGAAGRPSATVAGVPGSSAATLARSGSRDPKAPPAPARAELKNPFPPSGDGTWLGGGEYFLTVEHYPLRVVRGNFLEKVAGALLIVIALVPAMLAAAVGGIVGSFW